jgi:geranylgeranyl pyrophosphate synthase
MGIAFQMADDLRDLLDDSLGKDRYADLKNRNPSYALASLPDPLEQELRTLWSSVFVTPHAASAFGKKLERGGTLTEAVAALDKELMEVVALWTSAGLPEQVAEEICRGIRAQLGKREDA